MPPWKGNDAANPSPFHCSSTFTPCPAAQPTQSQGPGDTGMIQRLSRLCVYCLSRNVKV
uniref:Uncharacterized protein n=1 Tax=Junco hyemalis TaxID=40217 RepID=A0A8C5JG00_JUNHY